MTHLPFRRAIAGGLVALGTSCTPVVTAKYLKTVDDYRIALDYEPAGSNYTPDSKLFRIAVVDFVDQTNNYAGKVEDMFADVLTTELYKTDRFTLYDRGQLRRKDESGKSYQTVGVAYSLPSGQQSSSAQAPTGTSNGGVAVAGNPAVTSQQSSGRADESEQAVRQMDRLSREVDGVFLGFVTNAETNANKDAGVYTVDYRIVKKVAEGQDASHASGAGNLPSGSTLVIFADSDRVRFTGNPLNVATTSGGNTPVTLNREDLTRIADKVRKFFPDLQVPKYRTARVTDINGRNITISLGADEIKPGFSFFVVTPPDDQTGEFYYKAKFVIRDTFDHASRAALSEELDESLMRSIQVGDRILLK